MEIALLIIVALILYTTFMMGYKKGIMKIILSVAITVVSFSGGVFLSGPTRYFIKHNTNIYENIHKKMVKYVDQNIHEETITKDLQDQAIDKLSLPKSIKKKKKKNNTDLVKSQMEASNFNDYIARALTDMLIKAISFVIIFIILTIGLKVISEMLNVISRLPVIKDVNKITGGCVGLLEGIVIIWVLCILLTAFTSTHTGREILATINSNKILSFIYNNNILWNLRLK